MATILPLAARTTAIEQHAPRARARLVLTRRGRVLSIAAAFLLGVVVALMVLLLVDGPWAFAGSGDSGPVVTVAAGDTLWAYADSYAPEGVAPQEFVDDVRRLNGLVTPRLTAGQEIVLPTGAETGR
ncbi:LysM peptidoglycan-binding domain-containing protein [Brachybacterium hainanense]|uniref:LysM peptidoglycan-binding domain-containing protein n=1 Tax=Brachybacterium hainanense TaxID=1541174 RepID=A0ABV6RES1_9MICO